VIPLAHIESLDEATKADEGLLGHLLRVGARVANAEGLGESGYRTVINNGAGAGQSVFHLHVHVLGGRRLNWPPG
jgi:histidine triad (HIT) family protein